MIADHRPRIPDWRETNMEEANGFRIPDRDGWYATRALGVSIALLFGLVFVLHAISS